MIYAKLINMLIRKENGLLNGSMDAIKFVSNVLMDIILTNKTNANNFQQIVSMLILTVHVLHVKININLIKILNVSSLEVLIIVKPTIIPTEEENGSLNGSKNVNKSVYNVTMDSG